MKNWYRHTDLGSHLSNARMVIAGFVATAILFASCQSIDMDLPATEQGSILTQFNVSVSIHVAEIARGECLLNHYDERFVGRSFVSVLNSVEGFDVVLKACIGYIR